MNKKIITKNISSLKSGVAAVAALPTLPLSEIQLQSKCFQWTWNQYPETRRCFFHVPNGGSRNKIEAGQLKASGVVAGIPDMILVWKCVPYAFEFKTETGILSESQKEVHKAWINNAVVTVIRDYETFQLIFKSIIQC